MTFHCSSKKITKEEKEPNGMAGVKETTHNNNKENILVYREASLAGKSRAVHTWSAI
jgi:hypothetical protein